MGSFDDQPDLPREDHDAGRFVEEMLDWLVNDSPRSAALVDSVDLSADQLKKALRRLYHKGLIGFRYEPQTDSMIVQRRMKNGLWKDI